eukprot:1085254-Amphidinium_carterae.1
MGEGHGGQDPTDLAGEIHSVRCAATHHSTLMPRARRMGLKLWWKPSGSDSNAQRNSEKAWVDTTN